MAKCVIQPLYHFTLGTKRFDSEKAGDREVQRTMLELLNQMDGFQPNAMIKVIQMILSTCHAEYFVYYAPHQYFFPFIACIYK